MLKNSLLSLGLVSLLALGSTAHAGFELPDESGDSPVGALVQACKKYHTQMKEESRLKQEADHRSLTTDAEYIEVFRGLMQTTGLESQLSENLDFISAFTLDLNISAILNFGPSYMDKYRISAVAYRIGLEAKKRDENISEEDYSKELATDILKGQVLLGQAPKDAA